MLCANYLLNMYEGVTFKMPYLIFIAGCGCWIHQLHLCNEYPGYDTKQSDGEAPVVLELWGIWNTSSLPLLPGPLWPGVVAPDWVLSMGQIEQTILTVISQYFCGGARGVMVSVVGNGHGDTSSNSRRDWLHFT